MINLLPREEKNRNRQEYRIRFFTVLANSASVIVLVALIPLALGNLLVGKKISEAKAGKSIFLVTSVGKEGVDQQKIIADMNRKIAILSSSKTQAEYKNEISGIFDLIFKKISLVSSGFSSPVIRLTGISYDIVELKKKNNVKSSVIKKEFQHKISLSGVANTRADFVAFVESLENDAIFSEIDAPISGLVSEKDIIFSISLLLNNK